MSAGYGQNVRESGRAQVRFRLTAAQPLPIP